MLLNIVNRRLICGTIEGKILFLNIPDLEIVNVLYLARSEILYAITSSDYKIVLFSVKNKSKIFSFESERVLHNHNEEIIIGRFNDKFRFLVFYDINHEIFILKDYARVAKVADNNLSFQIFLSCAQEKVVFRSFCGEFVLINLDQNKVEANMDKVRKLEKDLKYPKKTILISSLKYVYFLHYS